MIKVRKIFLFFLILISLSVLSAVDFDPYEDYGRFQKGFSIGGAILPSFYKSSNGNKAFELGIELYASAEFSMLGFGIDLPLRFIWGDDSIDTKGGIPKEDWDDARDWVSILTYFHYGHSGDMFYFYFGEQRNRYVGNGSIVGAYYGDLRLYHPQRGVNLEVNTDYAGIDFFMDDVMPPNIIGGRVYLKPLSFFNKENYGNNLEIGASYFADVFAPENIVGKIVEKKDGLYYDRDIYKSNVQIFGFDISFRPITMKYYQLAFYTDINHIVDAGTGLHFGAKHKLMFPGSMDIRILSRWEGRAMQPDYIPSYFDTFYDIEREYYKGQDEKTAYQPSTKSQYLREQLKKGEKWTGGYYFDLVFDLSTFQGSKLYKFAIGGSFEQNRLFNPGYIDNDKYGAAKKYNNYQVNVFFDTLISDFLAIDFLMTFHSLGERGSWLKNAPYYKGSVTYYLNKFFSFGVRAASKWYLSYSDEKKAGYYKYYNDFSIGGFAALRF